MPCIWCGATLTTWNGMFCHGPATTCDPAKYAFANTSDASACPAMPTPLPTPLPTSAPTVRQLVVLALLSSYLCARTARAYVDADA
jgi:hypothetical protein